MMPSSFSTPIGHVYFPIYHPGNVTRGTMALPAGQVVAAGLKVSAIIDNNVSSWLPIIRCDADLYKRHSQNNNFDIALHGIYFQY
jgi:hypothetical protein